MADTEVVLVGKFISRKDHRNTNGSEEAYEGQFDAFFGKKDSVVLKKVEEALVAEPLNIVRADIVYCFRPVAESEQTAINQLAHGPFEAGFLLAVLAQDGRTQHVLELFVPQTVEPSLSNQLQRHSQFLSHDEKPVGSAAAL